MADEPVVKQRVKRTPRRPHLTQRGVFKSNKYPWCKAGFLPLKLTDETAQSWMWGYALLRGVVDREFLEDVHYALDKLGYRPGRAYRMILLGLRLLRYIRRA